MPTFLFCQLPLLAVAGLTFGQNGSIPSKPEASTTTEDSIRQASEPSPNRFYDLDETPRPLNMQQVRPIYPQAARDSGISGKVIVRVLVDTAGVPIRHIIMRSPHQILTDAVSDAIPNIRFTPAIAQGKPIKAWVTIPFDFKPHTSDTPAPRLETGWRGAQIQNKEFVQAELGMPTRFKGFMVVEFRVAASGDCLGYRVLQSNVRALVKPSRLAHLSKARFTPALRAGQAAACEVEVTFTWE